MCEADCAAAYPTRYTHKRKFVEFELTPHNTPEELDTLVRSMLLTKYEDWTYEDEVRMFEPLDEGKPMSFKAIDDRLQLKEVILGARCTNETRQKVEGLAAKYPGSPRIFKAQLSPDRFEMIEET